LTFDARFTGRYHSEGRDYSELFDALGSSDAASLRQPAWATYTANPNFNPNAAATGNNAHSIVDNGPNGRTAFFTGLSDASAYGSMRGSLSVTWQAASLFKLQVGFGYKHDQGHGISGDQPCNPSFTGDLGKSGPCHSDKQDGSQTATGIPNPNYRPTINS